MTANPERGEVEIILGGMPHTMRPTFEALIEMEQGTGQKIVPLVRSVTSGNFGVHDLAVIITAGLRGGGETDAKISAVGKLLVAEGLANEQVIAAVNQMLVNILRGGGNAAGVNGSGEAKAAARN